MLSNGGGYGLAKQQFDLPTNVLSEALHFSISVSVEELTPGAKPQLFKQDLNPDTFRHLGCNVYYLHLNLFKPLWKHRDVRNQPVVRVCV